MAGLHARAKDSITLQGLQSRLHRQGMSPEAAAGLIQQVSCGLVRHAAQPIQAHATCMPRGASALPAWHRPARPARFLPAPAPVSN